MRVRRINAKQLTAENEEQDADRQARKRGADCRDKDFSFYAADFARADVLRTESKRTGRKAVHKLIEKIFDAACGGVSGYQRCAKHVD